MAVPSLTRVLPALFDNRKVMVPFNVIGLNLDDSH